MRIASPADVIEPLGPQSLSPPLAPCGVLASRASAARTSDEMKFANRPRVCSGSTRATIPVKREHSSEEELPHRHEKKKKKHKTAECEKETATLKPDPPRSIAASNRFFEIGSSSRTRRKHNGRDPSGAESSRNWAFSSHASSSYKGSNFVSKKNKNKKRCFAVFWYCGILFRKPILIDGRSWASG